MEPVEINEAITRYIRPQMSMAVENATVLAVKMQHPLDFDLYL